jgi:hypothetical protein
MVPENFYPFMEAHLAEAYPVRANLIGKQGLCKVIEQAIERGKVYGIESRYEYMIFGEAALALGIGFDTDPQLPWAKEILSNEHPATERMDELDDAMTQHIEKTFGEAEDFPRASFEAWKAKSYDDIEELFQNGSHEEYHEFLSDLWPQKYDTLGPDSLDMLPAHGDEMLKLGKVSSQVGKRYLMVLQFLLGHTFYSDPQYFWLHDIISDPTHKNEDYMLTSLHFTVQQLFEAYGEAAKQEFFES